MEILDVVDENGIPTGETVARDTAHKKGIRHRTAHVWIVRKRSNNEIEVLLQKRSRNKDSYPGCFDISSAGHIPAGEEIIPSALRELKEELGLQVLAQDLIFCGNRTFFHKEIFHGSPFLDSQFSAVYLLVCDRDAESMKIQKEEIEEVVWIDLEIAMNAVKHDTISHCIALEELLMVERACSSI